MAVQAKQHPRTSPPSAAETGSKMELRARATALRRPVPSPSAVRTMQHDLSDAVEWAIKQGIADKDNVCIYGGSYGGYATLAGMAFTPELYKCGVGMSSSME